ncbi:MAG: hypothetical protein JXA98_07550 [Methanosarcinaceae archaeon]|nr:hypothetical protein [Methanosarcinaceae archaeon]
MSQKIVYLDQHGWINLAQAYFGKTKDKDIIKVCEIVRKASQSDDIIFPLSINHLIETRKMRDSKRRERLIEFMSNVSKGYTILPFSCITDAEIRNAILRRLGFCTINIKDFVIKKGISHMLGGRPKITGDMPESVKNIIIEWLDSPEIFEESLRRMVDVNEKNSYIDKIKELEDERSWYASVVKDKQRRHKFVLARNMMSVLSPKIVEICIELNVSISIFENWTEKDFVDFIEEIPTFYVPFSLSYSSESNFDRSITINDIFDVFHLSIAIPYCDIILPDKMFARIIKQQKLDQIYPAVILSSIKELREYI